MRQYNDFLGLQQIPSNLPSPLKGGREPGGLTAALRASLTFARGRPRPLVKEETSFGSSPPHGRGDSNFSRHVRPCSATPFFPNLLVTCDGAAPNLSSSTPTS